MKFLFASDSFKGTLSTEKTAEILTEAAGLVFPQSECIAVPVADGGEGTVDAVVDLQEKQVTVTGDASVEELKKAIVDAGYEITE